MSKKYKILIVIFCIGVLICGLGTGIAFMEFSSLTYGGKQMIGKTKMVTENVDVPFEPGEEPYLVWGQWGWEQTEIVTDSKVPEGTVRFQVTYNAEYVAPHAYLNEEAKEFHFTCRWTGDDEDEIGLLMEAKDLVLQNLKERKIISLDRIELEEVVVLVNPENEKDVRLVY